MINKIILKKSLVILIIVMLLCTGLSLLISFYTNLHSAEAASIWYQTSDKDFSNATFHNTTIIGDGENANIEVDLSKLRTWNNMNPSISPIAGYYHSLATIWGTDKVMCYGGYWYWSGYWNYNETWVYDLSENKWTRKYPANHPGARSYHAIATIWGTDKIVLFGGYYAGVYDDTWIYDLSDNDWYKMIPLNSPSGRYYHSMASIHGTDKVLLFGGYYPTIYGDTWIYDLSENTWTQKTPANTPYYRYYHGLSSVWGEDKVLLFGGYYYTSDETWVYDLSDDEWTRKQPLTIPGYRWYHAIAPVWGTDQVMLFGGYGYWPTAYAPMNDTWVYDVSDNTWTLKKTRYTPSAKYYHSMASVWGTNKILLFGGYSPTYGYWAETWIYRHFLPSKNGTYISNPYDTNSNSDYYKLSWYAKTPINTSLRIQLRSANSTSKLEKKTFVGPDGDPSTFYTSSPSNIWPGHNGDRWIQYKVLFNMKVFTDSPVLKDISISYNCLPYTRVISPITGSILTNNRPTFSWNFEDTDSTEQKAFQLVISNSSEFKYINFDTGEQITSIQRWEFPMGTSYTEIQDGKWYWKVRTMDEDNRWTEFSEPWTLIIDTQPPSSAATMPANDGCYNCLTTLTGIATDPDEGSGVAKIEIAIARLSDNYYWDGSNWVPLITWFYTNGTKYWIYDSSIIPWESGSKYCIRSRATDIANNVEDPGDGNTFIIDMNRPSSRIDKPFNNVWLNNIKSIEGRTIDPGNSGIKNVKIKIECIKSKYFSGLGSRENTFWNGLEWKPTHTWLSTNGTNNWYFNSSSVEWSTGSEYLVQSRATDNSGNVEIPSEGTKFLFDNQPPELLSIQINNNDDFTNSMDVTLSLHAEDKGSGISQVSFSNDGLNWLEWEPYNSTREYKLLRGDDEKDVYFRVRDIAGNIADPVFDSIILDTEPPEELSIVINNNEKYTSQYNAILELKGSDSLSGISDMAFGFTSDIWLPWEPFMNQISINLLSGDGEKIVFFKLRDKAGNIAEPVYDTIILDTTPPYLLMALINEGSLKTNSTSVTITINAMDNTSGLAQISFSTDGEHWHPWKNYSDRKPFTLPSGNGNKTVHIKVKDRAGNEAGPISDTIYLEIPPQIKEDEPTSKKSLFSMDFWILLILIIIIILIQILGAILNRRRRKFEDELLAARGLGAIPVNQMPATMQHTALPSAGVSAGGVSTSPHVFTSGTASVPVLAKTTYMATATGAQNLQLPQLPPAKIQDSESKPENSAISTEPKPTITPTIQSPASTPSKPSEPQAVAAPTPVAVPAAIPTPTVVAGPQPHQGPSVHLPETQQKPTLATPTPTLIKDTPMKTDNKATPAQTSQPTPAKPNDKE